MLAVFTTKWDLGFLRVYMRADIIVNNAFILELKSMRRIFKAHELLLVNCHVARGKPLGLILNFGERKVEIRRKVKDLK